jgi:secondary thiamine-phosphate synthase enzyme
MHTFNVKTSSKNELVDITDNVKTAVRELGIKNNAVIVYCPHTTAGITINENADPAVKSDIIHALKSFKLEQIDFKHCEGNSPAHVKSSLTGCSEIIIVNNGKPVLGTWQGIFFCEFDGPRNRKVHVAEI